MIKLYKTETGSIYEVKSDTKEVRRVYGINDPTFYLGQDGSWKKYEDLSEDFDHLVIVWGFVDDIYKTTITSKIVDYDEKEEALS